MNRPSLLLLDEPTTGVNSPEVLFLDEPSTGLDPQNRAHLQALIRDLYARTGATIVLTTHYLEEADALSTRVVVVDHGRVIADDSASNLKAALGDLVTLHLPGPDAAASAADALRRGGEQVDVTDARVGVRMADGPASALSLLDALRAAEHPVVGVEVQRPSLDDVFLNLTGRSLRESADESTEENAA